MDWYCVKKPKVFTYLLGCWVSLFILNGCAAVASLPPDIVKELTPSTTQNNYQPKTKETEAKP
ncbi:hypothetical protein [Thiofilum flexile]|uniref:hypothetical protein n=1 Tax=Thiofilum flexile TaxID=125627 RepID=UPI0003687CA1|nr:hypothetical protein [Thiofilum flexile]